MTDFLGSGAFGEVYEGIVRAIGEKEQRVAIKVKIWLNLSLKNILNKKPICHTDP